MKRSSTRPPLNFPFHSCTTAIDHLCAARVALQRDHTPDYDPFVRDEVFRDASTDLDRSISSWILNAGSLLNGRNWNLPAGQREPRIWLRAEETSKGNLVLEWYPFDVQKHGEFHHGDFGDFRHWNNIGSPSRPDNRLVHVRRFLDVASMTREEPYLSSARVLAMSHLLVAMELHLQNVVEGLRHFSTTRVVQELRVETQDPSGRGIDIKCERHEFVDPVVVAQTDEKRRNDEWLSSTFATLGFKPEVLLKAWAEAAASPGGTAKALRNVGITIRADKAKLLVERLQRDFADLYRKHTQAPGSVLTFASPEEGSQ